MNGWDIVLIFLITAVVAIGVCSQSKRRKTGKSSCGGHCGHCPMGGSCHNH